MAYSSDGPWSGVIAFVTLFGAATIVAPGSLHAQSSDNCIGSTEDRCRELLAAQQCTDGRVPAVYYGKPRCCWPGQRPAWSGCFGTPACPEGTLVDKSTCRPIASTDQALIDSCFERPRRCATIASKVPAFANDRRRVALATALAQRSCEAGEHEGCLVLGRMYLAGSHAVRRDVEGASELFERGCEGELPDACGELGRLLVAGRHVAANPERGKRLLEEACHAGELHHCRHLAMVYRDSHFLDYDAASLTASLTTRCQGGERKACRLLARELASDSLGEGSVQDARLLLERLCNEEPRDRRACEDAGRLASVEPAETALRRALVSHDLRSSWSIAAYTGIHRIASTLDGPRPTAQGFGARLSLPLGAEVEVGTSIALGERRGAPLVAGLGWSPVSIAALTSWQSSERTGISLFEPFTTYRFYAGPNDHRVAVGNRFGWGRQARDTVAYRVGVGLAYERGLDAHEQAATVLLFFAGGPSSYW